MVNNAKTKRRRLLFNPSHYKLAAIAKPDGEVQHFHTTGTGFTKRQTNLFQTKS